MSEAQVQAQPSCRPLSPGQAVSAHRGRPIGELLAERPVAPERSWPAGSVGRAELEARLGPARPLSNPALERAHGRALVDWPALGVRARLEGGQLRSISFGAAGEAALQGLLPAGRWSGLMGAVEPELRLRLGEPVHWGDGWYHPAVARWQAWTWGAVDDQVEEGLLVGYSAEGVVVELEWWLPRSPRWPRDDLMPVRLDRGTEGQ